MRKVITKLSHIFFMLLLSMFLGACGKFQQISTPDDFVQTEKGKIGLIWITTVTATGLMFLSETGVPTASHYFIGAQGLLDVAVNNALASELKGALTKIKTQDVIQQKYFNVFRPAFENNNFTVVEKVAPYCTFLHEEFCPEPFERVDWNMVKIGGSSQPIALNIYDYSEIIKELDVDYLFVINVIEFGSGRSYFSMVPTSPPKGKTTLVSYLIDGQTNKIISQNGFTIVESVEGEWDEPPEYPNLMKAVHKAFEIAMDEVFIDTFKQAP